MSNLQFYALLILYVIIFSIVAFIFHIVAKAIVRGITAIKTSINNTIHINYLAKQKEAQYYE